MWRWLVRAALSAIVLAILVAVIPVDGVIDAFSRVGLMTWTTSLGIFFGGHYLNALKFRRLLGSPSPTSVSCIRAQYAGLAANLGLPGISGGDLVRAAYVTPVAGVARTAIASIADRAIDIVVLLTIVAVALPLAGIPPPLASLVVRDGPWLLAAGCVIAGVAIVGMRLLRTRIRNIRGTSGLTADAIAFATAVSIVVQSAFVLTNVWLASSAGVDVNLAAWFVAWPVSKLVAVLPISLGGLGVREAALVTLLTPYGAAGDAVLATGFLWQGILAVSGIAGFAVTHLAPDGQLSTRDRRRWARSTAQDDGLKP